MVRYFTFFIVLIFLGSCSIQSRKDQDNYRLLFSQKNFKGALDFLNESSLKKDKLNELLYLMEKGSVEYGEKRYKAAAKTFVEANELVDKLYTKSVKQAIASSVLNDNSKSYYGAIFERSMLYQYQALSFYKLAQEGFYFEVKVVDGKKIENRVSLSPLEMRKNYDRARSTLIAWDSFFQELSRQSSVKTFLKQDLIAKLMAAKLHEGIGSRRDKEIALQLYKDAGKILQKIGPTLKTFNQSYKDYNGRLKMFFDGDKSAPKLSTQKLTGKFDRLSDHIDYKVLSLTKKIRPGNFSSELRRISPSKEVLAHLKKPTSNVSIVLEEGLINPLHGKDYSFNLRSAIDDIDDPNTRNLIRGIGIPILTYFAMGPLGLGAVSHHGNVTVYSRHNIGEKMTEELGVEFELPYAEPSKKLKEGHLQIYKNNVLVQSMPVVTLTSLSDYAFINSQEMIENSFNARASRVAVKYVTAIIAAYTTYKQIQKNSGELFAKPAALAQFLISQKAIKESEKADVRHWTSLPDQFLNLELFLEPGEYDIKYSIESLGQSQSNRLINLGKITVSPQKQNLFSYRII